MSSVCCADSAVAAPFPGKMTNAYTFTSRSIYARFDNIPDHSLVVFNLAP